LFLKELLGSFASITSEFVMNRSLLNTIYVTAFKLAVTVSSVILINLISPLFVDVVSSWIFFPKTVSKFRVECLWCSISCRALQLCHFASRVRKFFDGIYSIMQQSLRKTFDLDVALLSALCFNKNSMTSVAFGFSILSLSSLTKGKGGSRNVVFLRIVSSIPISPNLRIPKASNSCSPWLGSVCLIVKGSLS
jgi:hypothetical protein